MPSLRLIMPIVLAALVASVAITVVMPTDSTFARSQGTSLTPPASGTGENVGRLRQSGRLRMLPQIVQPGPHIRSAAIARSAMFGKFEPARAGREVVLQRQSGTSWVNVATDRQNRHGVAEFKAPAEVNGQVATYRVFARAFRGAPRVVSSARRTDVWGQPDFDDAFNGTSLSSSWSSRVTDYNPKGLRRCSKGSPKAVEVRGGLVRLSVIKDPARRDTKCRAVDQRGKFLGRYSWRLNGHISTGGERSFRYGVSAARVKFQQHRGQHGSFWMKPQTPRKIPGRPKLAGAEIDVIEWFGKGHPAGGLSTHAYYLGKDGKTVTVGDWIRNPNRFLTGSRDSWYSRFHVFSVEWTPSRYIYRIDGREVSRTTRGVSGQPEFLILSLLSSDWELPYLGGESKLPETMKVDWVRHWKR